MLLVLRQKQKGAKGLKVKVKFIWFLFICTLLFFYISNCSFVPRNLVRPVEEGKRWRVRLVKYENASDFLKKGGFDHPYNFSLVKLNRILGSIYYSEPELFGKGKKTPLFDKKVRATLLVPFQKAFSMAQPDEVVDFAFMISERSMVLFSHEYFTSGIMFIKDGKLNLVMRVVDYQVENYETALRQFVGDPTKRALKNPWHFVPGPGQSLKKAEKSGWGIFQQDYYSNWLIIDLNYEFSPAPLIKKKKRVKKELLSPSSAPAPVKFETPLNRESVIKTPVRKSIDDPEIRRKLQLLRELYNSGEISRQTYERKKEELLSP